MSRHGLSCLDSAEGVMPKQYIKKRFPAHGDMRRCLNKARTAKTAKHVQFFKTRALHTKPFRLTQYHTQVLARKGYGKECDVWSAGVILYILLCGFSPFGQRSVMTKFDHIKKAQFQFPQPQWKDVSQEARDLISGMLCVSVQQRLTCRQCLEHAWLRQLSQDRLPKENMPKMQARLREWNAARKLMAAIHTCTALSRMTSCDYAVNTPTPAEARALLDELKNDPEREDELRASFRMLDRSNTGKVRVENLSEAVSALGFQRSEVELRAMLDAFDVYHMGYIDFDEYCIMMAVYGQSALARDGDSALVIPVANSFETTTERRRRSQSLPLHARYQIPSMTSPTSGAHAVTLVQLCTCVHNVFQVFESAAERR